MNPTELILKKRGGEKLMREELQFLVNGYLDGTIPDYQMSAFLMAVYFQKMDFEETTALTEIMMRSGAVADLSSMPGIKVDKHSTGGVGDKVSLILAPMVAACGVPVPMISGRGLGHTGGTLDKLESIPGFRTNLSMQEFKNNISKIGVAMGGQTSEIAPADKKIYALRDVTGTVECIPLIASSIMSKKLAEGIDALVLDVKSGRGAFMDSEEKAIELAKTLITVGEKFGKNAMAFITDMSQPLGCAVGNWFEVIECIECLQGKDVHDLMEVAYVLGGAMVKLGGKATSVEEGIEKCRGVIQSGKAFEKFKEMVKLQNGDVSYIEHPKKYPQSKHIVEIKSSSSGNIGNIDAYEIGMTSIILGAGRMKVDDVVDPKAGIVFKKKVGEGVRAGETIAIIYTDIKLILDEAKRRIERAIEISATPVSIPKLIRAVIDDRGVHSWM